MLQSSRLVLLLSIVKTGNCNIDKYRMLRTEEAMFCGVTLNTTTNCHKIT